MKNLIFLCTILIFSNSCVNTQLIIRKMWGNSIVKIIIINLLLTVLFLRCASTKSSINDYYLIKLSILHNDADCVFYYIVNGGKLYDANYIETFGYEDVDIYNGLDTMLQRQYSLAWETLQDCKVGKLNISINGGYHNFKLASYKVEGRFQEVSGNFSKSKFSKNIFSKSDFFVNDRIFLPLMITTLEKKGNIDDVINMRVFDENLFIKENEMIFFMWCGVN